MMLQAELNALLCFGMLIFGIATRQQGLDVTISKSTLLQEQAQDYLVRQMKPEPSGTRVHGATVWLRACCKRA